MGGLARHQVDRLAHRRQPQDVEPPEAFASNFFVRANSVSGAVGCELYTPMTSRQRVLALGAARPRR